MTEDQRWNRIGLTVVALYALFFCTLTSLPFLDLPNHATRAFFIGELLQQPQRLLNFEFHPHFMPYILGDLVFAGILRVLPFYPGTLLWFVTLLVAVPLSIQFYLRTRHENGETVLIFLLVTPFFATTYFYLSGYINFAFGFPLSFLTLAFWERFARSRGQSIGAYLTFCALATATYAVHLAPFFFLCVFIGLGAGCRLLSRRLSFPRFVLSALPLCTIVVSHVLNHHLGATPDTPWEYRTIVEKLLALSGAFVRYNYTVDTLMVVYLGVACALILWASRAAISRSRYKEAEMAEIAVLSAVLVTLFFVLPIGFGPAGDVDIRALPYTAVVALLHVCRLASPEVLRRYWVRSVCFFLSFANLGYLACYLVPINAHVAGFTEALDTVPAEQNLLGISTRPAYGRLHFSLHTTEIYMTTRGGFVPYVFSYNSSQDQLGYFQYKRYPYAPSMFWYDRWEPVDWNRLRQTYDYVLIEKPYDPKRVELDHLDRIFENDDAVLFRLPPR